MRPKIGRRRSIHFKAGLVGWKSDGPLIDAILRKEDDATGYKVSDEARALSRSGFWYRKRTCREVPAGCRRGSLADTAGGIVLRTVAGTEEAVVTAFMGNRDAAEMGADADHDQPLVMPGLDTRLVGLRIGQARDRHCAGLLDLLLGAVHDVDRFAAPEHLDVLSCRDRRQVDLDRRTGRDRRGVRVHLGDERPDGGGSTDCGHGARCNKKEITACWMVRRRRCRHDSKPFLVCSRWNRPDNAQCDQEAAGARGPRGGRKPLLRRPKRRNSSPESFYWHPCRTSASPLSARKRAMH